MIHRPLTVFFVAAVMIWGTPQVRYYAVLAILTAVAIAIVICLWSYHRDNRK